MQDKHESKNHQGHTTQIPPPPVAPIPPANQTPVPSIDGQGAAPKSGAEQQEQTFANRTVLRDWVAIGISALTLILLGATVFYAKKQWIEMDSTLVEVQKQTVNTEEFFRADERAWVVIEITPYKTYPASGRFAARIMYGFYPKNIGKTIARDVHIHLDSATGADGKAAILGPQSLAPGERAPASVITAGDVFLTTFSGRIDYVDAFGVSHWKTFCYRVVDASGVLEQCPTGNNEDNNPETHVDSKR